MIKEFEDQERISSDSSDFFSKSVIYVDLINPCSQQISVTAVEIFRWRFQREMECLRSRTCTPRGIILARIFGFANGRRAKIAFVGEQRTAQEWEVVIG